ncbi:oligopeptide:H+ symporter [Sphingomonas morindae]|uniref:Oligopeptide:H+ symporter n=1 Tax=Sphingomonas morindae TaxID=1541170 RepID=A0ABY4XDJ9_9SPHN|nr:oligopeptide:H+ symporter [Sphingomonas morindae]USI74765.1 oligopeptide:H+ symporter [Sphingomonas morindae]
MTHVAPEARAASPLPAPAPAGGHPPGLAVLALTETWERFSFYGMQALLLLYLATELLPARQDARVLGLATLRRAIGAVAGPLPDAALAAQIFGLYAGLVYLTPLAGGAIGDRWLGRRATVTLGALLMAAGHMLLIAPAGVLIGLGLLILGSGCLKGNIATQLGALYPAADPRRERAFLLFNLGINAGAFAGPLLCGAIAAAAGSHAGFGAAGVAMLIGLAVYRLGGRALPPDAPRRPAPARRPPIGAAGDGRRIAGLIALMALALLYNIPFGQGYAMLPLWVAEAVDRRVGGHDVPIAWYLASDGLVTMAATPLVLALVKAQAARGRAPGAAARIATGCALLAAADLLLTALAAASGGAHRLGAFWPFGYFLLASTGYLFVMPVLLAEVSRAAPARATATLMGLAYAGLFVANLAAGWLARFYAPLGPARFWALQAGLAAAGALIGGAMALARRYRPRRPG